MREHGDRFAAIRDLDRPFGGTGPTHGRTGVIVKLFNGENGQHMSNRVTFSGAVNRSSTEEVTADFTNIYP